MRADVTQTAAMTRLVRPTLHHVRDLSGWTIAMYLHTAHTRTRTWWKLINSGRASTQDASTTLTRQQHFRDHNRSRRHHAAPPRISQWAVDNNCAETHLAIPFQSTKCDMQAYRKTDRQCTQYIHSTLLRFLLLLDIQYNNNCHSLPRYRCVFVSIFSASNQTFCYFFYCYSYN